MSSDSAPRPDTGGERTTPTGAQPKTSPPQAVSRETRWKRAAAVAVVIAIAVHWTIILNRRVNGPGDFDLGREMGRRFLAGEPLYEGGLHYPYPPSAALFFAPLALLDDDVGLLLRYLVALAALGIAFRMLADMLPDGRGRADPVVAVIALVLGAHYLIRDLDDGGPHLILLAMLVAGIRCAWRGRDAGAAFWVGFVTAVKPNAGLLLPFFVWKRRWRLAVFSFVATGVWMAAPLLWMGAERGLAHQRLWANVAIRSAVGRPIPGAEESESRVQNQALRPALERLLAAPGDIEPDRERRRDPSPWHGPTTAFLPFALLGGCLWRMRQPGRDRDDPRWLPESAAVLILALLLSPVAWVQHLVWLLPALFAVAADLRAPGRLGALSLVTVGLYALFSLGLNREILGRDTYLVLLGWNLHTVCMLLILALVLHRQLPKRSRRASSVCKRAG